MRIWQIQYTSQQTIMKLSKLNSANHINAQRDFPLALISSIASPLFPFRYSPELSTQNDILENAMVPLNPLTP